MKKFICILCVCAAVLGALVYGLVFAAGIVIEKQASIRGIQQDILLNDERQKNVKSLEKLLEDIEPQKKRIESVFIGERAVIDFIKALEQMASTTHIGFSLENAALPSLNSDVGPKFELRVNGSFDEVLRFIGLLEAMPYQILIDSVQVRKQSGVEQNKGTGTWTAAVKITLLSFVSER